MTWVMDVRIPNSPTTQKYHGYVYPGHGELNGFGIWKLRFWDDGCEQDSTLREYFYGQLPLLILAHNIRDIIV
jgi:hypothetical protein